MSGKLWPVKLAAIFAALNSTGILKEKRPPECFNVDAPADGLNRIYLSHPDLQTAVRKTFNLRDFRIRIAYPTEFESGHGFVQLCNKAQLEVYGADDRKLVAPPVPLTKLDDDLANAVQVELLTAILKVRGIDIPSM